MWRVKANLYCMLTLLYENHAGHTSISMIRYYSTLIAAAGSSY